MSKGLVVYKGLPYYPQRERGRYFEISFTKDVFNIVI